MIAFGGARSTCDMFARNSDLCWLAASSCRLLSSISRKRRAFWMASADCMAKVCSSPELHRLACPSNASDRALALPRAGIAHLLDLGFGQVPARPQRELLGR